MKRDVRAERRIEPRPLAGGTNYAADDFSDNQKNDERDNGDDGIGFIGGGAILKESANVRGLATASRIWCTGAIGAAVAFGREEIGVVLSFFVRGNTYELE